MLYIMVGSLVFGIVGAAYGVTCYYKLWQWARQCQHARIVVSYKSKVKLNAPLLEWLLWANMLDKDKDANGRVVYTMGGSTVAIIKRGTYVARGPITELRVWLMKHLLRVTSRTPNPEAK